MLRKYASIINKIEIIFDFLIGNIIIILLFKFLLPFTFNKITVLLLAFIINLVQIWFFKRVGLYASRRFHVLLEQGYLIIKALFFHGLISSILFVIGSLILKLSFISCLMLLVSYYFLITIIFLMKGLLIQVLLFYVRGSGFNTRKAIVICETKFKEFLEEYTIQARWGMDIIGYVASQKDKSIKNESIKYLGNYEEFETILTQNIVDVVIFLFPLKAKTYYQLLQMAKTQGKGCLIYNSKTRILSPKAIKELSIANKRRKFFFDFFASSILLMLLTPLFMAIALGIKVTSKGPVFFRQKRVGFNGRIFWLYKFRSMYEDAESRKQELTALNEMQGPVFKIKNDPRVTFFGKFLRKTSLDELPQLFNVLTGDMSLVGPRPPLPEEVEKYEHKHRKRLSVKPGLTCIWQVSGRNQINDFNEWVDLDLQYIDNYSFWADIKLIARTIKTVITFKGAS